VALTIATLILTAMSAAMQLAPVGTNDRAGVRVLWQASVAPGYQPSGTPATSNGVLFVISSGLRAYALDSGRALWNSQFQTYNPRSIVAGNGRVFVVEATVAALDAATGHKIWEFTPDANASLGRSALKGNRLYFGTSAHDLYALRISDGKVLWHAELGHEWEYPAVVRGLTATRGTLYAAVEQWRTINGTRTSGWLIALDSKSGKTLWRFWTGSGSQRRGFSSSPVVTSRLVLVADYLGNAIEAIDRKTGKEVWRFEGARGFVGFPEAPIVVGNSVYAGSGDMYVYAINLLTGRLVWRTKMPAANEAYTRCGKELLVSYNGLAALDRRSGRIDNTLLGSTDESVTSDFATFNKHSFVAGPKGVYAFACR
jgi:outer membrane protein assembly factor BamB